MQTPTLSGTLLVLLCCISSLMACAQPAPAPIRPQWKLTHWNELLVTISSALMRGNRIETERLCARAIAFVEAQAIQALRDYADLLDSQHSGGGTEARARAERLHVVRGIMLKGNGAWQVLPELWPMLVFLLVAGVLALSRYRQTLD